MIKPEVLSGARLRKAAADFAAGLSEPVRDSKDTACQQRNQRLLRAAIEYAEARHAKAQEWLNLTSPTRP